jgi:hypothetical protein
VKSHPLCRLRWLCDRSHDHEQPGCKSYPQQKGPSMLNPTARSRLQAVRLISRTYHAGAMAAMRAGATPTKPLSVVAPTMPARWLCDSYSSDGHFSTGFYVAPTTPVRWLVRPLGAVIRRTYHAGAVALRRLRRTHYAGAVAGATTRVVAGATRQGAAAS